MFFSPVLPASVNVGGVFTVVLYNVINICCRAYSCLFLFLLFFSPFLNEVFESGGKSPQTGILEVLVTLAS